ncbi:hypothetical protein M3201_20075 [Paenibacillus motobuensis]|uniref:hypothetical protein n=1 Tax=Paenibacillus TaxID=44249 RepID=UPI00203E70B3|nr:MULTISPECIES: hypothetical protein [Paenibacillus]MCM3041979.1 hypothetical protein [Paenibacillus lutimineralis]MCM3649083.1 hypothetical protein [Paenibacillus motobuensis]
MAFKTPEQEQEDYVRQQINKAKQGDYTKHKDIDEAENGSMINDMEDLVQLGEDMEQMKTNSEDHENGLMSDPEQ